MFMSLCLLSFVPNLYGHVLFISTYKRICVYYFLAYEINQMYVFLVFQLLADNLSDMELLTAYLGPSDTTGDNGQNSSSTGDDLLALFEN